MNDTDLLLVYDKHIIQEAQTETWPSRTSSGHFEHACPMNDTNLFLVLSQEYHRQKANRDVAFSLDFTIC